jgi:hypothetical protein
MNIRSLAVAGVLVAVAISACKPTPEVASVPAPAPGHFALVVERSTTGWAAKCEVGCGWTDVAMRCADCAVQLDATGIGRVQAINSPANGFVVLLSGKDGGWQAQGLAGTAWQSLSWTCSVSPCRARVDETGVRSM